MSPPVNASDALVCVAPTGGAVVLHVGHPSVVGLVVTG
jgi:hypothetical protein